MVEESPDVHVRKGGIEQQEIDKVLPEKPDAFDAAGGLEHADAGRLDVTPDKFAHAAMPVHDEDGNWTRMIGSEPELDRFFPGHHLPLG